MVSATNVNQDVASARVSEVWRLHETERTIQSAFSEHMPRPLKPSLGYDGRFFVCYSLHKNNAAIK